MGGVFGAFFITVGTYMSFYRKKFINTDAKKIIECMAFAIATISVMVLCVIFFGECSEIKGVKESEIEDEKVSIYN